MNSGSSVTGRARKSPRIPLAVVANSALAGFPNASKRLLMARLALCRRYSVHARRRSTTRAIWRG